MDLIATDREDTLVGHLGPDILAPGWDLKQATQRVRDQGEREIGLVLLDQRVIAGIGTFFMSEAAFLRGVNPWTPTSEVAKLEELVRLAHRLMVVNVNRAVQVTTGNARKGQESYVHARSGRPCRRCGSTIRVAPLGEPPNERPVFWCPHCQPGVVPTDDGRPRRPLGAIQRTSPRTPPRQRSPYRR
nr:hypothetical protein [Kineosporia babensis]